MIHVRRYRIGIQQETKRKRKKEMSITVLDFYTKDPRLLLTLLSYERFQFLEKCRRPFRLNEA